MIVFTVIGFIVVALIAIGIVWEIVGACIELKYKYMDRISVPFSETGGTFKIVIKDYRVNEFIQATLYEFKKKYKWSRKPTWVVKTGGASHYSSDSVESWVYGWLESHPDAKIENTSKSYVLPTKLQRAEAERKEAIEHMEKMIKISEDMVQLARAYNILLDNEKRLNEDNFNRIKKRIDDIKVMEDKRKVSIERWSAKIIELDKEIETLKAA